MILRKGIVYEENSQCTNVNSGCFELRCIYYATKYCVTYICSVMDYANEMIKKADTDNECKKALPLVKAMLNYGAYSQIYLVRTIRILQMPY